MECVFCQIIAGKMPADIVHQDDEFLAFRDIQPQAPIHVVIIPRSHIASITELTNEQQGLIGRLILLAGELAEKEGISGRGYRLAMNCGADGGQLVPHLHLHVLGGRRLDDQLG
ncbi:MAG: histidine triad nucleotide-binding protein [Dehalococcoidia bacterium]|nr:histidine triad nucleotide-binding protein [Dehalococcoidia bacterium]